MTKPAVAAALACAAAAPSAHGAVLLSEVVFNEVGSDVTGEWVEIVGNDPSVPTPVDGLGLGDEEAAGQTSATEAMYRFPTGATIPANDVLVVAVSATRFAAVYGFNPDFEFSPTDASVPDMILDSVWDTDGGAVNMSNTNDQIVLVDAGTTVVDAASWGNTFAFNPGLAQPVLDGQSYRRINLTDTNTAADWEVSPDTGAAATRSSPGVLTATPEPAAMSLIALVGAGLLHRRRRC